MVPAGGDDRGPPACQNPSGFIAERTGGGSGHDDVPTGHVDFFRHRFGGEQTPYVLGGFEKCARHASTGSQRDSRDSAMGGSLRISCDLGLVRGLS